jgi:hypothetical protein
MSQTDSHEPSQGDLSGEVTNRLLMDMPQSPRRAQNRVLTFFGVFVFLIAVAGIGFVTYMVWTPEDLGVVYLPDLSYREFRDKVSTKEIDPRGASNIYYRREAAPEGTEGYNLWMRMTIPKNSYEAMLRRRRSDLESLESQGVKVTGKSSSRIEIPAAWPQSEVDTPLWWDEIKNVRSADSRCNTWEMTARGMRSGYFWAYDPAPEKLYIWQWESPADRIDSGGSASELEANEDSIPNDAEANPDEQTEPDADSDSYGANE